MVVIVIVIVVVVMVMVMVMVVVVVVVIKCCKLCITFDCGFVDILTAGSQLSTSGWHRRLGKQRKVGINFINIMHEHEPSCTTLWPFLGCFTQCKRRCEYFGGSPESAVKHALHYMTQSVTTSSSPIT